MNNYQSLKDIVYNYISEKINNRELKPNESIQEAAICDELNISRTPVREALMKLSIEGFIEYIPRRGFFTKKLTLERVRGIYQIIGNLEALASCLALKHPDVLDINQLHQLVDQMDEAISFQQYDVYNQLQYQFHYLILKASCNEDIVRLVSNLKRIFMRHDYIYQSTVYDIHKMLMDMNDEHRHIVELIETKNEQGLRTMFADVHWNEKYAEHFTYM